MVSVAGNLPFCSHRYALFVSYLGTKYNGSQRQINREQDGIRNTVQEALEWSLEGAFPKKRCQLTSCSRTDKGVHAHMNCFTLPLMNFAVPTERIKHHANRRLLKAGHEILVNQVLLVPALFNPRQHALSREYIYRLAVPRQLHKRINLYSKPDPSELMCRMPISELFRVLPVPQLDLDRASDVINLFQGEHDFAAFSMRPEETRTTVRTVDISLADAGAGVSSQSAGSPSTLAEGIQCPTTSAPYHLYEVHVKSKGFLHNQVRRMVGALISHASYGTARLETIKRLLENPKESLWPTELVIAEPYGLYLSKINYHRSSFEGSFRSDEGDVRADSCELPTALGLSEDPVELAALCLRRFKG